MSDLMVCDISGSLLTGSWMVDSTHVLLEPSLSPNIQNKIICPGGRGLLKGARTSPTQFFVDGCYARLLLLYTYRGLLHDNTRTKYLPKEPLTNFKANLEEISGPGYKTLRHFFGAVR